VPAAGRCRRCGTQQLKFVCQVVSNGCVYMTMCFWPAVLPACTALVSTTVPPTLQWRQGCNGAYYDKLLTVPLLPCCLTPRPPPHLQLARNQSLGITPQPGMGGLNDIPSAPGAGPTNDTPVVPAASPVAMEMSPSPEVTASDTVSPSPAVDAAAASPSPATDAGVSPSPDVIAVLPVIPVEVNATSPSPDASTAVDASPSPAVAEGTAVEASPEASLEVTPEASPSPAPGRKLRQLW
jgi:hypothetical protein